MSSPHAPEPLGTRAFLVDLCPGTRSGPGCTSSRLPLLLPRQDRRPEDPFAFWRYRVNEILAEDDLQPTDSKDVELRRKGYPFHAALRTEQGEQWWLPYSAAQKIYEITVKPEDSEALPFDRSYPDAGYAPRPITMKADYEQLPEDFGYPLNAAFNKDEELEEEPRRRPTSRGRTRDDYRGEP